MTHKDMATTIRTELKNAGISAKCRMIETCGVRYIQVNAPAFDVRFSDSDQIAIRMIAKNHGLTFARGSEIDIDQMTNPFDFNFEFHG